MICQCCVHSFFPLTPNGPKYQVYIAVYCRLKHTDTSDVCNRSLGSSLKNSSSLLSILHPLTDQIFCDYTVLIPEESSIFRWCSLQSWFRVQACCRWHGLEWHLRMMFGVTADTLGIERIICSFCPSLLYSSSSLHPNKTPQISHQITRLLSEYHQTQHQSCNHTNIRKPEDRQEVLDNNK